MDVGRFKNQEPVTRKLGCHKVYLLCCSESNDVAYLEMQTSERGV